MPRFGVGLVAFFALPALATAQPLSASEAAKLAPELLARRLFEMVADNAAVVSSSVGKPALSTIISAYSRLRQQVEPGPIAGMCNANEITLSAANIEGPDSPSSPLTIRNVRLERVYRIVGRVAATEAGAMAMVDGECVVAASDPMFGSDTIDAAIEGAQMLQVAMDLARGAEKPDGWLDCDAGTACIAELAQAPVGKIYEFNRDVCYVEGNAPIDPLCVQYEFKFGLDDPKPTSHSWSSIVITLTAQRPEPFGQPTLVRVRYGIRMSIV